MAAEALSLKKKGLEIPDTVSMQIHCPIRLVVGRRPNWRFEVSSPVRLVVRRTFNVGIALDETPH